MLNPLFINMSSGIVCSFATLYVMCETRIVQHKENPNFQPGKNSLIVLVTRTSFKNKIILQQWKIQSIPYMYKVHTCKVSTVAVLIIACHYWFSQAQLLNEFYCGKLSIGL
jgi:hypothetical protein